ncbi:hypothetical protein KKD62_00200 [Patescibacteria group bacterium]|nr:hypothetical protein [Patescibacteria group bacterium]MBU1931179.1 hypothetical protein [Patescibacteria group bacterium]
MLEKPTGELGAYGITTPMWEFHPTGGRPLANIEKENRLQIIFETIVLPNYQLLTRSDFVPQEKLTQAFRELIQALAAFDNDGVVKFPPETHIESSAGRTKTQIEETETRQVICSLWLPGYKSKRNLIQYSIDTRVVTLNFDSHHFHL